MVDEILDSCKKTLEERMFSPFFGSFVVSWLIWNWQTWYVTFFVDSELLFKKEQILKIDFITNIYKVDSFLDYIANGTYLIVFPFISAWFFVYIFSKITFKFYVKHKENEIAVKLINLEKERELNLKEAAKFNAQRNKLDAEKNVLEKETTIKKIKLGSEESLWLEEFEKFKKHKFFNDFKLIKESIYSKNGKISWDFGYGINPTKIDSDLIAYCDTHGLIEIKNAGTDFRIGLTVKGKYFMKKYTE